jgi:diadenosine tetraphosphate (Ap4A) HIT family hydrolase
MCPRGSARRGAQTLARLCGYLLGWNQGGVLHPHMHVIPRFDDEPLADRWLPSAVNVAVNRRRDPWMRGSGRALRDVRQAPRP